MVARQFIIAPLAFPGADTRGGLLEGIGHIPAMIRFGWWGTIWVTMTIKATHPDPAYCTAMLSITVIHNESNRPLCTYDVTLPVTAGTSHVDFQDAAWERALREGVIVRGCEDGYCLQVE